MGSGASCEERITFILSLNCDIKYLSFFPSFAVQLCGSHPGTPRNDSQTAGAGDRLQDHGARQGIDEGQEEGKFATTLNVYKRDRLDTFFIYFDRSLLLKDL